MKIIDSCARCLLDKQIKRAEKCGDEEKAKEYIERVKAALNHRSEEDCSPYMVSVFNEIFAEIFGTRDSYGDIKKEYNDLVLSMEEDLYGKITEEAEDEKSLIKALLFARIGNYIDFGAMNQVDKGTFLGLFDDATFSDADEHTFQGFCEDCSKAKNFLLIADNCGEIVLDKLFITQLKKCFPQLLVTVMVRGGEVLNDATVEDAVYVGMDQEAKIVENGTRIAGTVYERITKEAKETIDRADVILAKGQGNYESMSGKGMQVYYSFLCKCDLFTDRFKVPRYTGMFVAEK